MSVSLATTRPQLAFAEAQEGVVGSGGGVTKLELCQKEGEMDAGEEINNIHYWL